MEYLKDLHPRDYEQVHVVCLTSDGFEESV
jgi:hypothetical protein